MRVTLFVSKESKIVKFLFDLSIFLFCLAIFMTFLIVINIDSFCLHLYQYFKKNQFE